MEQFARDLAEMIEDNMRVNNYEARRVTDDPDNEAYSIRWIVQSPDTGLHFTIEVAEV